MTRVQILVKAVYISHSASIVGKGMNPTILLPTINKLYGNQSRRRKTEFKPVVDLEKDGLYQAIPAEDTLYE